MVYLVAVDKQGSGIIPPPGILGAPCKGLFFFIGQVILMVALHITDCSIFFLVAAPGNKIAVDVFLVAGQRDPKVKNITQKYQFLIIFFQSFKHLKKDCMVSFGSANVGICDDDHYKFPFPAVRCAPETLSGVFKQACKALMVQNIINGHAFVKTNQ